MRERVIVRLGVRNRQPGARQDLHVLLHGAGVGEARDPAGQGLQLGVETRGLESDVGDADAAARLQHPRHLGGGRLLVGEGAERALAHNDVDRSVGERDALGVAEVEPHAARDHPGGRGHVRLRNGDVAQVDAVDLDAELGREQERGRARSAGDIEHAVARAQPEGTG
jgi:hypothetical protein